MTETEHSKTRMMDRDSAAALVYHDLKTSQRATFQVAAEWGRWLTASLVLVHSGALFGMFSLLNNPASQPATLEAFKAPVWCFVAGLLMALASGFFA
jgi:hypothetical protein